MRPLVPILLIVCAFVLAGCHEPEPAGSGDGTPTAGATPTPDPSSPHIFTDSFEGGIDAWTQGSDVPDDPNEPGERVRWNITATDDRAHDGDRSVNFTIDGRQDDGTIWLEHPVQVAPGVRYQANVSAHVWSVSESFNTIAHFVSYLGTSPPEDEGSFPQSGGSGAVDEGSAGQRSPLNLQEGWREYSFEWETPATDDGMLHVALGITVVWETQMTYFADDVRVTLDPIPE